MFFYHHLFACLVFVYDFYSTRVFVAQMVRVFHPLRYIHKICALQNTFPSYLSFDIKHKKGYSKRKTF